MLRLIVNVLVIVGVIIGQSDSLKLHFESFTIKTNPKVLTADVKIKPKGDHRYVDIDSKIMVDLPGPVTVDFSLNTLGKDDVYKSFMKYDNVNYCELKHSTETNSLVKLALGELVKFGNISDECPIKMGSYYARDFHIADDLLPTIVPTGKYRCDILAHIPDGSNQLTILETSWFLTLNK